MIQTARKLDMQCPHCKRPVLHVYVRGRDRHFIECPPCDMRSGRFGDLESARRAWLALFRPTFLQTAPLDQAPIQYKALA